MTLRYTLRQLEYFVAVGEEGSIARASERVNVSSPSISAAVTQLEKEFGLPLFIRKHAQGLFLTQAGHQFMDQALRVLKEANALSRLGGQLSGSVQGQLRVGCLRTFAQLMVPGLRRVFEVNYPDVRIIQRELHQLEIFDQLLRARIDIALTYNLDIPGNIVFKSLIALPPYALFGASHPLAHRACVTIEDLCDHPMVLLDLPHSSDYFMSLFAGVDHRPRIVERTRDMAVVRSLVANGFGFSVANTFPLTAMSPDGRPMTFVPIENPPRMLELGLAMTEGTDNALVVRAFAEHCAGSIAAGQIAGMVPPG